MGRCGWATTVFGFVFFGLFGDDPEGASIWSRRSAVFRFVRICSDSFRVVRDASEGLTVASFVKFCQPLVTCGKCVTAGGAEGGAASLREERHVLALLFCYEGSLSWGEWGCVVGDSRSVGR